MRKITRKSFLKTVGLLGISVLTGCTSDTTADSTSDAGTSTGGIFNISTTSNSNQVIPDDVTTFIPDLDKEILCWADVPITFVEDEDNKYDGDQLYVEVTQELMDYFVIPSWYMWYMLHGEEGLIAEKKETCDFEFGFDSTPPYGEEHFTEEWGGYAIWISDLDKELWPNYDPDTYSSNDRLVFPTFQEAVDYLDKYKDEDTRDVYCNMSNKFTIYACSEDAGDGSIRDTTAAENTFFDTVYFGNFYSSLEDGASIRETIDMGRIGFSGDLDEIIPVRGIENCGDVSEEIYDLIKGSAFYQVVDIISTFGRPDYISSCRGIKTNKMLMPVSSTGTVDFQYWFLYNFEGYSLRFLINEQMLLTHPENEAVSRMNVSTSVSYNGGYTAEDYIDFKGDTVFFATT